MKFTKILDRFAFPAFLVILAVFLFIFIGMHFFFNKSMAVIASVATILTFIATSIIGFIAYYELEKNNKVIRGEFMHKLKTDFFTDEAQFLYFLFENNLLIFETMEINVDQRHLPFFRINQDKMEVVKEVLNEYSYKDFYVANEIDSLLIGHFEDLGILHRNKLIDIDFIYECFGHYIELLFENRQIDRYITWLRQEFGSDIYDQFKTIYIEVKKHGDAKKNIF